jgi:YHS domain-containing protein
VFDAEVRSMNAGPERLPCDPVCGRELSEEQSLLNAEVNGERYPFCSERCRRLFFIRPELFLERIGARPAQRAS